MSELMSDFFSVTQDEINKIESDGKFKPENGKDYTFQITEIKEKQRDDYKMIIITTTEVASKLEYAIFVKSTSRPQLKTWLGLLKCFFSDEQLKRISPTSLVGKTFIATAKTREYEGRTYSDLFNLRASTIQQSTELNNISNGADSIPF